MRKNVLLTGGTGFVGQQFISDLAQQDVNIFLICRDKSAVSFRAKNIRVIHCKSIESYTGEGLPESLDVIVHLAGIAHVTIDDADSERYHQVNVEGTRVLCELAKEKKVKHFIFMSSIKVHGDSSGSRPFSEHDSLHPLGPYAKSKYLAEQSVRALVKSGIRSSLVRPPLVYGKGVKANMAQLVRLTKKARWLPFGCVKSKRSYIGLRNLSDILVTLVMTPPKYDYTTETFLVTDSPSLTLGEVCKKIGVASGVRVNIVPIPVFMLSFLSLLIGKYDQFKKLVSPLEISSVNMQHYFDWEAKYAMSEEMGLLVKEL